MKRVFRWMGSAVALIGAFALLAPAVAQAHRGGPGGGCHDGSRLRHIERRIDRLGLDAATQKSVHDIIDQAKQDAQATRDKLHAARKQMRELLAQDNPDENAVLAQADTLGALQTEMRKSMLQNLLQVRKLLTADQWQQLHKHFQRGAPDQPAS